MKKQVLRKKAIKNKHNFLIPFHPFLHSFETVWKNPGLFNFLLMYFHKHKFDWLLHCFCKF